MVRDIRLRIEIGKQAFGVKFPCPQDQDEIDEFMPVIEKVIRETLESEILEN